MILGVPFSDILFYVVAIFMIFAAICTVVSKNILQSAIFLIATFMGTAVVYLLLRAEFMAVAQIMVYIGGVVVFMIFAILLTSHLGEDHFKVKLQRKYIAAVLALAFVCIFVRFILKVPETAETVVQPDSASTLGAYAARLLSYASSGFVIPFELISILLLMALIAAATVAKKHEEDK